MRFVCESCRAQYMINDEKVGPKGVKVRCRKCGYVILVKRGGEAQAKGPVSSAGADPDDALATQILQTPLAAAATGGKSTQTDTLADLTNPGVPPGSMPPPNPSDSLLGDAGDDEIGAVFDQVLNSGAHSISKEAVGGSEERRTEQHSAVKGALGDDNDDRMSTRVIDADVVRKLAEESGDKPADKQQWDAKPEKNGHPVEGEVPQNDWFVAIDEKQTGPLFLEKVKEHWDRGEIGPDSLCWRAGFTDWVPLSDVAQLASVLAPRPASKPIVMNAPSGPSVVSVPVESAFSAGGMMKSVRSEVQVPMSATAKVEETGSWRPSTSLGSLVQDEMAALSRPAPRMSDELVGPGEASVNGLLDLPSADEKTPIPSNGRTNGHAGASVDHLPQVPAQRNNSRPPAPAPPPANPYVATPGATYSSPGITQYRPEKDRGNLMIWAVIGIGAVLVLTLVGTILFLVNRQPAPVVAAPVQQPPPVAIAQPPVVQPPAPVVAQPVVAPVAVQQPGAAQLAEPTAPLPPGKKEPLPPRSGSGTGGTRPAPREQGTKVAAVAPAEKVEKAAPAEKTKSAPKGDDDEFASAFGTGDKETPKSGAAEPKKKAVYIPPAPGAASNDVKESLSMPDVLEVVTGYKPALAKCVEEQRKKEPGVTGKLVMTWKIQTNGKTSNVAVAPQSEEFKTTYMAGCVGGLVKTWTFPKHKVVGDPILFPFKF